MDKNVIIATHDGMFHPDDVFSVATLLLVLEDKPVFAKIVRSREETLINKADFVVDVGSVYDESKERFDHHQEGGAGQRPDTGIKYASFGLVWKKYGALLCGSTEIAKMLDTALVSSIDAGDNGQDIYKKNIPDVSPYLIDDFIYSLRPTWQEEMSSVNERFNDAVAVAKQLLKREIVQCKARFLAEGFVKEAYDQSQDKRIIVLDKFYPSEKVLAKFPEPIFSVTLRADGLWNVKAIRDDSSLFKNRKDLPEAWAGKRDGALSEITGVSDAVFCHNGRFLAVAKSKEGAIKLANLALSF